MSKQDRVVRKILELTSNRYPDAEVYLYGSQARGDAKPMSDWVLLFLLHVKSVPFLLETKIMDEFYEIELETGEIITPLIYPCWRKSSCVGQRAGETCAPYRSIITVAELSSTPGMWVLV